MEDNFRGLIPEKIVETRSEPEVLDENNISQEPIDQASALPENTDKKRKSFFPKLNARNLQKRIFLPSLLVAMMVMGFFAVKNNYFKADVIDNALQTQAFQTQAFQIKDSQEVAFIATSTLSGTASLDQYQNEWKDTKNFGFEVTQDHKNYQIYYGDPSKYLPTFKFIVQTKLDPGTYYVRAFCKTPDGSRSLQGNEFKIVVTQAPPPPAEPVVTSLPIVQTLMPTEITGKTAIGNGKIIDIGAGERFLDAVGFQFWTEPASIVPPFFTNWGTVFDSARNYSDVIGVFEPNTTYYIRAVAQNALGRGYGQWLSFKTPAAITVTALPATGITDSSAKLNGSVVASSNTSVTGRGFKYWKNPNPKDDPNCGQPPVSTNQVDTVWVGYGVGNFSFTFGQQASPASPSAQPLYSDTFYCYGALATDSQHNNFSSSVNKPFKTLRITATNWAANPVAQTTATLRGYVDKPVDSQFFLYGINPDPVGDPSCSKYVESYNPRGVSATNSNGKLAAPLTGLTPNTNYCYSAQIITIRDLIYPKSPDGKRVWRAFKTLK